MTAAANTEISELESSLANAGNNAKRSDALNRLAYLVGHFDLPRAITLAEQALNDACHDRHGRLVPKAYAETCVTLGRLLVESAGYERADKLSIEAANLFENHAQTDGQFRAMLVSTQAHLGMGNYPRALELGLIQMKTGRHSRLARAARAEALNGIGLVYAALGDHQAALQHHQQASALSHAIEDWQIQYVAATNCCVNAHELDQLEDALAYGLQALKLALRRDLAKEHVLVSLGEVYCELHRFTEARQSETRYPIRASPSANSGVVRTRRVAKSAGTTAGLFTFAQRSDRSRIRIRGPAGNDALSPHPLQSQQGAGSIRIRIASLRTPLRPQGGVARRADEQPTA